MAETTLRDTMNASDANRIPSAFEDIGLGDLMTLVINGLAATEAALVPASNVITMATTPRSLFDVKVATGTLTGSRKIIKGRTDPDGSVQPVPAAGEATWNGGTKVRLTAGDVALTVDVKYATAATSSPGYLRRSLGEQA